MLFLPNVWNFQIVSRQQHLLQGLFITDGRELREDFDQDIPSCWNNSTFSPLFWLSLNKLDDKIQLSNLGDPKVCLFAQAPQEVAATAVGV